MPITYDGGLTCSLGVTNLEKSLAWYTDILDFKFLYRRDDIAWCELSTAVARVNVGLSQIEKANPAGGTTLTFGITDMQAAKATLDAANVKQDGPIREIPGMVRLLTFYDPDGNTLMFYQDLTEATQVI